MPSPACRRGSKRKLDAKDGKEYGEQNGHASNLKNATIPGDNISEVFSLLHHTETAVCRADDRLGRNQARLKQNQGAHSQVMRVKQALEDEAMQLAKEISEDKVTVDTGRKQLNILRFWGESCVLRDLPHELLLMVFQYLGYVHQRRLIRVSRVWKELITSLDHIYCDALSFYDFRVDSKSFRTRKIRKVHRVIEITERTKSREHDWKLRFRAVRHLTFDGMLLVDTGQLSWQGLDLAKRLPNLVTLNFTRAEVSFFAGLGDNVNGFISQNPAVRVTISQSMVRAIPSHVDESEDGRKIVSGHLHSYRRIQDWTVPVDAPGDKLRAFLADLIWPYPDQQINWLARYAPQLNDRVMAAYTYVTRTWHRPRACVDCSKLLCNHRDVAFYKNELKCHQSLNVLAIFILQMRIPGMEPPPVPFQFEQLRSINGRYQLVSEV